MGTVTRPSHFYTLSPDLSGNLATLNDPTPVSLGLGPISLPDLYDRPHIVTRSSANRIELAQFHRWGGELHQDLSRVLVQNLIHRVKSDHVVLYPWSLDLTPDYQITIEFFRFDGELGTSAKLTGIWRLLDTRRECVIQTQSFTIDKAAQGKSYPAQVAAMSQATAQLSDDIAQRALAPDRVCQSSSHSNAD